MKRKSGRKRAHRKHIGRTILKAAFFVLLIFFLAIAAGITYTAVTSEEIDANKVYERVERTSYIYDKDGELLGTLHYDEDRMIVSSSDIPQNLKDAVIAIEDKTFYSHHGFNFKRMLGAVVNKLIGKSSSISGTSTITQQLARNVFLSDIKSERTIQRKATEMYYAYQLEKALSKEEILEAYLNTIYLGYGCYGVNAASKTYFSCNPSDLNLAECAALAALPQAPDSYALLKDEAGDGATPVAGRDCYSNDASKDRRDLTLDLMAEQGYISQEEADNSKVDIADIINPDLSKPSSAYTYFTDYVASELVKDLQVERGMTEEAADRIVHTGGLQIYTTLDADAQRAINDEFEDNSNFPNCVDGKTEPQASMVITEVDTGKIIAMSGGRNANGQKLFNRAVSPRQPGSAIKPLSVYSAALQKSFELQRDGKEFPFTDFGYDRQGAKYWGDYITAGSYVSDEKMVVDGEVWPLNFSRRYSGRRTFRTALQQSLNTCAVKIQLQVGSDYSLEMLKKYGISTVQDDVTQPVNDANPAALALGAMTYGATPLDMALAYGSFPGGGIRRSAICYTSVEDSDGNVIIEKGGSKTQVLDKGVAWIMTDVLQSVVSRGIATAANVSGVQAGGKTGTTNDAYDIWFCGFTPKYSAALWIGTDQNVEMNTTSSAAAALWSKIMEQIPDATEGEYKDKPDNVVYSGGEYYTEGTQSGAASYRGGSSARSSSSSSSSSGSSNSGGFGSSDNSGANGSDSGYSRDDFVRDFTGGSYGNSGSSDSTGQSKSSGSSGGGNSREQWLKNWQSSN